MGDENGQRIVAKVEKVVYSHWLIWILVGEPLRWVGKKLVEPSLLICVLYSYRFKRAILQHLSVAKA